MIKEETDRIRADIAKGYLMGGCFIDAIRDDLLALLHDNELAYHYAQKFQRDLLETDRELQDAKALLREARESVFRDSLCREYDDTHKAAAMEEHKKRTRLKDRIDAALAGETK